MIWKTCIYIKGVLHFYRLLREKRLLRICQKRICGGKCVTNISVFEYNYVNVCKKECYAYMKLTI